MDRVEFNGILESVDGPMVHHIMIVPDEVALIFAKEKGSTRILCSICGDTEFPCALIPRNNKHVMIASKQLLKKHKLSIGSTFKIIIRLDPSNGLELPEEFAEVLAQDEFAYEAYTALNDGGKRGYIYYIRQGKSIETRIKRSFEIAEKLKLRHHS